MSTDRRSVPRELRGVYELAVAHGWRVDVLGSGHLRWLPPRGDFIVTSFSPSDHRARSNAIARFRKAGLPVPH